MKFHIVPNVAAFAMFMQFFPGDRKLQLEWLHNVAEMRIQQAMQDPSPTKMEPLVALLDKLGLCGVVCVFAD